MAIPYLSIVSTPLPALLSLSPAVLVVDGESVTSDPKVLSGVKVTGEIISEVKGPKINILRYKAKTGYRRRQGFRSKNTRVKITAINGVRS